MWTNTGYVMTLANSIIGVGILAMPFCFQKCGILLAIFLLILSNWLTRICCHYLIKSSLLTRRKSFEYLGFQAFGSPGKLLVELCVIGYLLGACITYFVVVGDLGPQIITKMFDIQTDYRQLRTCLMTAVTIFCIIPLAMLKNVDSLSVVCTASIGFYICLVVKIILESQTHIMAYDWQITVKYWQPRGILQCLPIFSMALSCQMQIFEVFNSINNQNLDRMNAIVSNATWICTFVYISMGFFGYVAFYTQTFSGNILMNLTPSFGSDVIKIGFVLSVAFSFPLVIFPCRVSLYSLLYRKGSTDNTGYIPEKRFKLITLFIVIFSLSVALMIPSVELIIGLVGSTIGVAICIMFPAACFRKIVKKDTTERHLAQLIVFGGFCLMILGTYANLSAIDERTSGAHLDKFIQDEQLQQFDGTNNIKLKEPSLKQLNDDQIKSDINDDINFIPNRMSKIIKPAINSNERNDDTQQAQQQSGRINKMNISAGISLSPLQTPRSKSIQVQSNVEAIDKLFNNTNNGGEKIKQIKEESLKSFESLKSPSPDTVNGQEASVLKKKPINDVQSLLSHKDHLNISPPDIQIDNKDVYKKEIEINADDNVVHDIDNKNSEFAGARKELKETKEILEKSVQELKVELAKQNQEPQSLVEEKLGPVVEKFEQIERKVQQQQEQDKVPALDQLLTKENDNNNNIAMTVKLEKFMMNSNSNSNKNIEEHLEKSRQASIDSNNLDRNVNEFDDVNNNPNNNNMQVKAVPLPVLINNTHTTSNNNNTVEQALQQPSPLNSLIQLIETIDAKVNEINHKNSLNNNNNNSYNINKANVDVIRRDILQLKYNTKIPTNLYDHNNNKNNNVDNSRDKNQLTANERIKRSLSDIHKENFANTELNNDNTVSRNNINYNCPKVAPDAVNLLNDDTVNINSKHRDNLESVQSEKR